MTTIHEQDLNHANERGNGPKKRMEGGDQTDDIAINNPDERLKEKHNYDRRQGDVKSDPQQTKQQK